MPAPRPGGAARRPSIAAPQGCPAARRVPSAGARGLDLAEQHCPLADIPSQRLVPKIHGATAGTVRLGSNLRQSAHMDPEDVRASSICGRLPFESPKVVEYLDGNYRTLASCTHQQLGRLYGRLRMTDLPERCTVTISPPEAQWELSFIDDDGGRQTRLEVTSAHGTLPGEHALALARACAA
jgi:hypothetical protein